MKTLTLKLTAKFKSGVEVPAGTTIEVTEFNDRGIRFPYNGQMCRIGWAVAHKYFSGFSKTPSMATLEKWASDSVCKTPTGKKVEPDGTDEYGVPSWLRIYGLI